MSAAKTLVANRATAKARIRDSPCYILTPPQMRSCVEGKSCAKWLSLSVLTLLITCNIVDGARLLEGVPMRSLKLLATVSFLVSIAYGQSDRSQITGTVFDPAGAVVANAPVHARNVDTGSEYDAVSTATGNYTLTELPVGRYQLRVAAPGFKTFVRDGFTVQAAQVYRIDIPLEVGAATESVTVTAEAPLLNTESSELSKNVSSASLNKLPVLGIGSAFAS